MSTPVNDRPARAGSAGAPTVVPLRLLARPVRATTVGLLLVVTLVAFEAMAVATAMPTAVRQLHGLAYYSWPFTAFLVTSVVGIVMAGERSDRSGPRGVLLTGLGIFAVGLIIAGTAPGMAVFVAGRAVQGFGAGTVIVAVYVVIAQGYDERLRPRVFAALSAAWVLPAVIGPAISGLLTQQLSWRLVFLGLTPFVGLGVLLLLPSLRRLPDRPTGPVVARAGRGRLAVSAAAGVGLLQYAGQDLRWLNLLPAALGAALLVVAVPRLLPPGTARLARGLPAVVAFRGLLAGAFFGADAFVPYTLTTVHGFSPARAGIPLTLSALGWAAGSWWQGRRPDRPRQVLLRNGFGVLAAANLLLVAVAVPRVTGWAAAPIWTLAGFGMGLAIPTISVLVLDCSAPTEQGVNSSALQISDVLGSGLCIGLAGVVLAWLAGDGGSVPVAVASIDGLLAAVALVGVFAAGQARPA